MRTPKKIRTQMTRYYLFTGILTLLVTGLILFYTISKIERNEVFKSTQIAVDKSGNYLELYIERLKAVSSLIAENPGLVKYFSDPKAGKDTFIDDGEALIQTAMKTDPFIKSIIMVSIDGRIISNETGLDMSMSKDMMKEEWYVAAIKSGSMPILTSARMQKFSMDKNSWVISISREIKDEHGQNIGVLLVDVAYNAIEDYLSNLDLGKEGFAFIINDENQVVYHKDPSYFKDTEKINQLFDIKSHLGYSTQKGSLTYAYHLKNADWTLVGVASLDDLKIIRNKLLSVFSLVGLLSALLMGVISIYFARNVTMPILKLEKAMVDVENGLREVSIKDMDYIELRSLVEHFNAMIKRIHKLMQEIQEKEENLRVFEIKALHGQINPHFLYNTLDTIVWMAEFNDSRKVIDITKALAQFFRLSLSGGNELTTVENELDHVRQYLFIQKERYSEQLNYDIYCEEEVRHLKIPKIIIQPLAENALYHGIRDLEHPGNITISAQLIENQLIITVQDNGRGFDVKKLDDIEEKSIKLGGVGLKNVDQRIRLYYGEQYGLQITSTIGEGTVIKVVLAQSIKKLQ